MYVAHIDYFYTVFVCSSMTYEASAKELPKLDITTKNNLYEWHWSLLTSHIRLSSRLAGNFYGEKIAVSNIAYID